MDEQVLTQTELATRVNDAVATLFGLPANCTDTQVRRWTSGAVQWPHPRYLLALEHALGRSAVPLPGGIGLSDVRRLRDNHTELHAVDGRRGGGDLVTAATRHYTAVTHALAEGSYGDQVGKAHIMAVVAIQAVFAGRPTERTAIARAALQQKAARASPVVAALFHARAGAGLARTGEATAAGRSFARAERALDRHDPSTTVPGWLAFFGPGELRIRSCIRHALVR
jgi:hypothetical protein